MSTENQFEGAPIPYLQKDVLVRRTMTKSSEQVLNEIIAYIEANNLGAFSYQDVSQWTPE